MIRQSGNIFDVASAICSRSNCALGFVLQYRVHYLVKCLCRTANSCKAGLIVGALRIACNGLCTAARFHSADDIPGCLLGCSEGLDCSRHYNQCPTLFRSLLAIWPGTGDCISPTAIFNDLLFKIAVRSEQAVHSRVWFIRCLVTAFNLQRTHQVRGLTFRELMHGRLKMMTALCPAWAHTYQTMFLGCSPEQLRPESFRLPKLQK